MECQNIFGALPESSDHEVFSRLLAGSQFRLERIVSTGQATPVGQWYDQDTDEWIVLLSGAAKLRFEDGDRLVELKPGDYLNIPAHCRHRVEWTHANPPRYGANETAITIWPSFAAWPPSQAKTVAQPAIEDDLVAGKVGSLLMRV